MIKKILLKIQNLFSFSCKPKYFLDENIKFNNVKQPHCLFVNFEELAFVGTSDERVFEIATRKNLIIVTRDVRFALDILTKKQNVIFETNSGYGYFVKGKTSKLIDYNRSLKKIKWPSKKQKRMLDLLNRTPFFLPMNGFYQVSVI